MRFDINKLRMSSVYTKFCEQAKRILCLRICSNSTTVAACHGANVANMGIKATSQRWYRWEYRCWSLSAARRTDSSTELDFLESVLMKLLQDMSVAMTESYATYSGHGIGRGVSTAWPQSSLNLTNGYFPVGIPVGVLLLYLLFVL